MELVFYWSKEEIDQDSSYACSAYNGIGAWCYDLVAENNKSTSNYFRCVK